MIDIKKSLHMCYLYKLVVSRTAKNQKY